MTIGNLFIIVLATQVWALCVGRLLVGLAFGIVYVPLIAHAGENGLPEMRGHIVSSIGLMYTFSTLMCVVLYIDYGKELGTVLNPEMLLGIVSLVLALTAALLTPCLTHESVVHMLQKGETDAKVTETMCRLRCETAISWTVHNDLAEMQRQLEHEQRHVSPNILRQHNCRPLLLVTAMRVVSWLSNNFLMNGVQFVLLKIFLPYVTFECIVLLATMRMLGAIIHVFVADALGRKTFVASAAIGGVLLVLLSIVLIAVTGLAGQVVLLVFLVIAQIAFGLSADTMPHVMAAEAFALRKKPWSVAVVAMLEQGLHICMCAAIWVLEYFNMAMLYVPALVIVLLVSLLYWKMPETRGMSLTQCREEFVGGSDGWIGGVTYSRENRCGQNGLNITFGSR